MTADAGHQLRVFFDALLENLPQHEANTDALRNATVQIRHGSIPISHEVTVIILHLSLFYVFIVSFVLSVCFLRNLRTFSQLVTLRRTHSIWVSFLASWTQPAFQGLKNICWHHLCKVHVHFKIFCFFQVWWRWTVFKLWFAWHSRSTQWSLLHVSCDRCWRF